jgi:AraC-like DNA-binding protein
MLASQELNFRDLLVSARQARLLDLLGRNELSLFEIALELGYSEHSAFSRAVRAWYGTTPANLRRAVQVSMKYSG